MTDVLLFIPRLLKDVALLIWSVISHVFELISRIVGVFLPTGAPDSIYTFIGFIVLIVLSFAMRKQFGGFLRAMLALIIAFAVGYLMVSINPIGAIITFILALLVGFNILKGKHSMIMLISLMWAGMLIYKVVA